MPPRHGKSEFASKYFPPWYIGTFPDRRVVLASYEADFAAGWGRKARDLFAEHGPEYFNASVKKTSSSASRWDVEGNTGGMDTAGVGGAMTGKGAHLLIIDDPVKNAEEANSETYRNKAWDWYTSTAYTRLEPGGAVVLIQTRWHEDDLAGRVIEKAKQTGEEWDILNLPAIALENDAAGRQPGEALWPERYDLARLSEIEKTIGPYWFSALFQQTPQPHGGGFFKWAWYKDKMVDGLPIRAERVRYWDTAGTEGGGDYTVGALVSRDDHGLFYVEDIVRGQWSPHHRNQEIVATAKRDGTDVQIWLEQEAGVGGKDRTNDTIRELAGYYVRAEPATGSKENRAEPFAAQSEAGNVVVKRADWNHAWLTELCGFPFGKDDQVDATSGAFNRLASRRLSSGAAVAMNRPATRDIPNFQG